MKCNELTLSELKTTNGCGSSYWFVRLFRIPEFLAIGFKRCCNRHDLRYQKQENKNYSDDELYDCWYYNAYHSPKWQRYWKLRIADIGYWAITTKISNLCYRNNGR